MKQVIRNPLYIVIHVIFLAGIGIIGYHLLSTGTTYWHIKSFTPSEYNHHRFVAIDCGFSRYSDCLQYKPRLDLELQRLYVLSIVEGVVIIVYGIFFILTKPKSQKK